MASTSQNAEELSESVKARIERNRQRAIILRQSKLVSHPYARGETISVDTTTIKIGATKYKDTGGGFLLEENPEIAEKPEAPVEEVAPIIEEDRPHCIECQKPFATSWLFENFDVKACDECKNKDPEQFKLIPRTEAMNEYLLKICDLDKREPVLKFIVRKNPHNVRWGDMKLYLKCQIEKRALEVWGSEDVIEEEKEKREEKKSLTKVKKYNKQMKELRMGIRSSLYDRTTKASHTHEFGPETYNEDEDDYTRSCQTCPYSETFEKM